MHLPLKSMSDFTYIESSCLCTWGNIVVSNTYIDVHAILSVRTAPSAVQPNRINNIFDTIIIQMLLNTAFYCCRFNIIML